MNKLENNLEWIKWYDERPECVKKLIDKFKPMDIVMINQKKYYVIGYTENNQLILSKINPIENSREATSEENKEYICADHLTPMEKNVINN